MENIGKQAPAQNLASGGQNEPKVQTQVTITDTVGSHDKVTKIIVAIHGVGDQYTYATIQSVVNQFCSFYDEPAAVPLGSFYKDGAGYSIQPPYAVEKFQHFAFAEVYWAKIPREAVSELHTLEETKKWARTIVERLKLRRNQIRHAGQDEKCTDADFVLIKQVLGEMIQTIAVLERLCALAERAGLFTFDIKKLLDDYLGDVQIVAEFEKQRRNILATFLEVMEKVHQAYPNAQIYLVAHSEGTVISFLGLLEGISKRQQETPGWIDKVRGFMTIGSPIDKHLILWPELFNFNPPANWPKTNAKIEWHNYYDYNDPIGFKLDDARAWLDKKAGWKDVFSFELDNDIGFSRYFFPGKAHVDYWNDEKVFGHFIENVVNKTPGGDDSPTPRFNKPPGSIEWKRWLSYFLPYVGVAALLFIAVYVLFKAVNGYTNPAGSKGEFILETVTAMMVLVFGVTIATRIPRLTHIWYWRLIAGGLYFICAAGYLWILPEGDALENEFKSLLQDNLHTTLPFGWTRLILATLLVGAVSWISRIRPTLGAKPLLFLGTAVVIGVVWYHLQQNGEAGGPLWPVFLATAVFFYLWWLAALIFDLIFVWHVYIRHSMALERMDEIVGSTARAKVPKPDQKLTK